MCLTKAKKTYLIPRISKNYWTEVTSNETQVTKRTKMVRTTKVRFSKLSTPTLVVVWVVLCE